MGGHCIVAVVDSPGRAHGTFEPGLHPAWREHQIAALEPKAAAELARAAGVRAQAESFDQERIARFLHFDGDQPCVAVTVGPERSGPVHVAERTPAAEAAVVALPELAVLGTAAGEMQRGEGPIV